MKRIFCLLLTLLLVFSLMACKKEEDFPEEDLVYTEGCDLGEGDTTYYLRVTAEDLDITFTVHTDERVLGKSLRQTGIVSGDESTYGLYIKVVNGVRADYEKDGAYWGVKVDGEYSMVGVDEIEIEDGKTYELAYTVG